MGCQIPVYNIPHKEGLEALEKTLQNEDVPHKKIETIIDFSKLVLTCNHFKFLGQHYLQMSGTAMGTKMAPSYANVFMGILESKCYPLILINHLSTFAILMTYL